MFSAHAVPARPRLTTRTNPKRRPRSPRGRSSKRPPESETPRFAAPGALNPLGQPAPADGLPLANYVSSSPFYGGGLASGLRLEWERLDPDYTINSLRNNRVRIRPGTSETQPGPPTFLCPDRHSVRRQLVESALHNARIFQRRLRAYQIIPGQFQPRRESHLLTHRHSRAAHKMLFSVNLDSTFSWTTLKNQCKGSRLFPSVQPSMILNAKNTSQSLMLLVSADSRSWLYFPFASN